MQFSNPEQNLFVLLFLGVAVHGIFLAVLLFRKSRKERELRMLGFMMLPVSFRLLIYRLYITRIMPSVPHLLGVFNPFLYLIAPAFYLFVRTSADRGFRFRWYHALHLLPAVYALWEWIPVYAWSADAKFALIDRAYQMIRPSLTKLVLGNRLVLILGLYALEAYFFLRGRIMASGEDGKSERLVWLRKFTSIMGFILFIDLVVQMVFWSLRMPAAAMELIMLLIISVAIHILGYVVLGARNVLPEINHRKNDKYATSPLSKPRIAYFTQRIETFLTQNRPWLDAGFTIDDMAASLLIPRHHVSQILSEGMHMSFYDLINTPQNR